MKIKLLILTMLVFFFGVMDAKATVLPKEVKDYLVSQKKVPTVRFDGVVVYNEDVMYLPIFPAYETAVDSLKIVKTYPENKTMNDLPDMVLFNNNMSLLKVIRTGKDTLSVRNIPEIPVEIKTGLLPQDIMVPRGFVLPDSFAGILGNVEIPLIGSAKTSTFVTTKKSAPLPNGKHIIKTKNADIPVPLKNKLFYVNNFQTEFLQVYSSEVSEPLYSLKTSGVMKDVKPVLGGKFLLAATRNQKNIDVIDVKNEYIVKHIDLTAIPSEIIVDDVNKKAYVASIKDESLSIIDLDTMTVKEKIQLVGSPQKLSLSKDGTKLVYSDVKTSKIYILDLQNNYSNKLISVLPNATKLILGDNVIYAIARTQPKLRLIYFDLYQDNVVEKTNKQKKQEKAQKELEQKDADLETEDIIVSDVSEEESYEEELLKNVKHYSTSIKDVPVGKKPVDIYKKDNVIYVLSASDNTVYMYNTESLEVRSEKLPVDGFSSAFTPVSDTKYAIITNTSEFKFVVFDMDKGKATKTMPVSEHINMITVIERK